MGMAASQARLLSITTRMSDNELRAQIINNSKMRLATESSNASAAYVTALNESSLMMSNTDVNGNSQYQKLTYNAMTQYSPTNNQYGLVNASGRLLVNEREASLFEKSNGDVDTFLKGHGLVFKSTFFDKLEAQEDGGVIPGFGMSASQLKELYFGDGKVSPTDGKNHYGYKTAQTSPEFIEYDSLIKDYSYAKTSFQDAAKVYLKNKTNEMKGGSSKNYKDLVTQIGNFDGSTALGSYETALNDFGKILDEAATKMIDGTDNEFYKYIKTQIEFFKNGSMPAQAEWNDAAHNQLKIYQLSGGVGGTVMDSYLLVTKNATGAYTAVLKDQDGKTIQMQDGESLNIVGNSVVYTAVTTGEDGSTSTFTETYTFGNWTTGQTDVPNVSITSVTTPDDRSEEEKKNEYKAFLNELTTYFSSNVREQYDLYAFITGDSFGDATIDSKKQAFETAAKALSQFIFGNNGSRDTWQKLDSIDWIKEQGGYRTAFQPIMDVVTLENLFDLYGEPKDAWSYEDENKTGNADSEAEWYTNLFERMKKGYKVLEDGLASSNEWIAYALESGLVSMEQVDKDSNWVATMYRNCSDISEKTDDLGTTKAEAQYKQAMARIESKDKMYDMELKNIDTEHNSLQTEYDSIKSVIDKNVERNFKLYS